LVHLPFVYTFLHQFSVLEPVLTHSPPHFVCDAVTSSGSTVRSSTRRIEERGLPAAQLW